MFLFPSFWRRSDTTTVAGAFTCCGGRFLAVFFRGIDRLLPRSLDDHGSPCLPRNWKSIFSICQTQDGWLEEDAFSRIWSEVAALNAERLFLDHAAQIRRQYLFFVRIAACCAAKAMRRYTGRSEKHRGKMTLAGKPHASGNSRHRPGRRSKEFPSTLDTEAGYIGVGRFACCRFEGSRKMIRAHMDARSNIFERELAG